MIWGCFAWSGVGNLAQIKGIMMVEGYIDVREFRRNIIFRKVTLSSNKITIQSIRQPKKPLPFSNLIR